MVGPTATTAVTRSGVLDGDVDRDLAALRVAHDDRPFDTQGVQHGQGIRSVGVGDILGGRPAEAASVIPDDTVAGCRQKRHEVVPRAAVDDGGMEQQDRWTRSLLLDEQRAAGHLQLPLPAARAADLCRVVVGMAGVDVEPVVHGVAA